jgi:hypothetical protein
MIVAASHRTTPRGFTGGSCHTPHHEKGFMKRRKLTMWKLVRPLFLAAFVATARAVDNSPLTHLSFQPSMQAGSRDVNGNLLTGTEIMQLVPHQGRLYASTSLWMESDPAIPRACQILVLDSPKSKWRVEHQFSRRNLRCDSLREVTFTTDAAGKAVTPVPLLLAAPDGSNGPLNVYCRDDATGDWAASELGKVTKAANTRAIGFHRDRVTGVDRVFAGTDKLGTLGGVYDPAAPGRIRWDTSAEVQTPAGERVMGFADCNGILYCATTHHVYQRTDGAAPAWKQVYFSEQIGTAVIRGLTAVPKPDGKGEVLWFVASGKVHRLDPTAGFQETVELDLTGFLTEKLGLPVVSVLAAYNDLMPYAMPGTGETLGLFGFQSRHLAADFNSHPSVKAHALLNSGGAGHAGNGRYCIRHVKGTEVTFEVAEITDPREPKLVATRTIAVSPFPEDQGKALYFGGYDCNILPAHNTAWIYRGRLGD